MTFQQSQLSLNWQRCTFSASILVGDTISIPAIFLLQTGAIRLDFLAVCGEISHNVSERIYTFSEFPVIYS